MLSFFAGQMKQPKPGPSSPETGETDTSKATPRDRAVPIGVFSGDSVAAPMAVTLDRARAAKAIAMDIFRHIGSVMAVGIAKSGADYAVKVNLREAPGAEVEVPSAIDGVPVLIEVTGPISPR